MRQLLVPLEQGGLVAVAGETELLKTLEDRLARAEAAIRELTQARGGRIGTELDTLTSVLTGVDWDLGRELQTGLEDKQRSQDKAVQEYNIRSRDWRAKVNRLKQVHDGAIAEGALVASETEAMRTLEGLVMQAERALREERYGEAGMPLDQLAPPALSSAGSSPSQARAADPRSVEQLAEDISSKALQARELARRAELLLLKEPSASNRVEYTLLLSTPSAPGSHGINIQGSRTLVKQDRALVREIIDKVTAEVNSGIQRRSAAATRTLLLGPEKTGENAGEIGLAEAAAQCGRPHVPAVRSRLYAAPAHRFRLLLHHHDQRPRTPVGTDARR